MSAPPNQYEGSSTGQHRNGDSGTLPLSPTFQPFPSNWHQLIPGSPHHLPHDGLSSQYLGQGQDGGRDQGGGLREEPVASSSTSNSTPPVATKSAKWSRQSRACVGCRKQKMRCLDAGDGKPCRRCAAVGRECVFAPSMRGKKPESKPDAVATSLKNMEETLQTVLQSLSSTTPNKAPLALPTEVSSSVHAPTFPLPPPPRHTASFHNVRLERDKARADVESMMQQGSPLSTLGSDSTTAAGSLLALHGLPDPSLTPLGLLADASLRNQRKEIVEPMRVDPSKPSTERARFGVANVRYFHGAPSGMAGGPTSLRHTTSESECPLSLLTNNIITPAEVDNLFNLFFTKCHAAAPILDPKIHTPMGTASRSPFLFTCVCTVASRYYIERTDGFYRKCLEQAKRDACNIIMRGFKSTEICLGFFLLCQWNQPAERFAEECMFQFSGISIRMAIDLNLHCKSAECPPDVDEETREQYEREVRNGERAWMYSYICDRSISNQLGKPYAISRDDLVIREAKTWHQHPAALPGDGALAAVVELQKILTRVLDVLYSDMSTLSGLNHHLDYPRVMRSSLGQLDAWHAEWSPRCDTGGVLDFLHVYYRLFVLSFAIQHALVDPLASADIPQYCALCYESAAKIITVARDILFPTGKLRHAIDCTFVFLTYACCFLLKLVNPSFENLLDCDVVIKLVETGADILDKCSIDETHTPALYSSFIRALVQNKGWGGPTAPASRNGSISPLPAQDFTGEGGDPSNGTHEGRHGSRGSSDRQDYDNEELNTLLSDGRFWDNMLMPGYGGPLLGIRGGTAFDFAFDPWDTSMQIHSRPMSPLAHQHFEFE